MGKPKTHRRRKGSSKAGRPKKAGDRYACGKLKPEPPNAAVLAQRAQLLGSAPDKAGKVAQYQDASTPLDLALARGWLTEAQHKAGVAYAAAYRSARLGAPSLDAGGVIASDPSTGGGRAVIADMSPAEIAAAWDLVFSRRSAEGAQDRQAEAFARWKTLNATLTSAEQAELHLTCVMEDWPQWLVQRVNGRFGTSWERRYVVLVAALDKLVLALRPPKRSEPRAKTAPVGLELAPGTPTAEPSGLRGPTRTDTTRYVDGEGELVLEVERKRPLRKAG